MVKLSIAAVLSSQPPTLVHGPLHIKSKTDYTVNSGIYQ